MIKKKKKEWGKKRGRNGDELEGEREEARRKAKGKNLNEFRVLEQPLSNFFLSMYLLIF